MPVTNHTKRLIESGKRNDRPELEKALATCKKQKAKLDRLSRNLAFIATLMDSGVEFIAVDNPHAKWRLVKPRYDDGGLSGGTLERPALQSLLTDIRSRKVDVVVVYKVDRLTRALADFAKLVELFEAHGVSFVAVTQQFNTTTSMGRLTLNVLLSFAQFERELLVLPPKAQLAAEVWPSVPIASSKRYQKRDAEICPQRQGPEPRTSCSALRHRDRAAPRTCPVFAGIGRQNHKAAQKQGLAGWGARIRTWEWRNQNPLPYHLATPHQGRSTPHTATRTGRGSRSAWREWRSPRPPRSMRSPTRANGGRGISPARRRTSPLSS